MAENYYVTPTPQPSLVSRKIILIGGVLVVALVIGALLLAGSGGNNISKQLQHLTLRLSSLQNTLESPSLKTNLKNEDLAQITTEFKLSLASSKNQLVPLMVEAGLPEKFDKDILASETDTSTEAKLSDAALNNKFDRVLAQTLNDKITSLRALAAETYNLTKNAKLRQALATLDKTLSSFKKRLDGLSL